MKITGMKNLVYLKNTRKFSIIKALKVMEWSDIIKYMGEGAQESDQTLLSLSKQKELHSEVIRSQ